MRIVILAAGVIAIDERRPTRMLADVTEGGTRHTVEYEHDYWSCTCEDGDCAHIAAVRPLAGQEVTPPTLTPADGWDWLELVVFDGKTESEGWDYARDNYRPRFRNGILRALVHDRDAFKAWWEAHTTDVACWWDSEPDAPALVDAHVDAQRDGAR